MRDLAEINDVDLFRQSIQGLGRDDLKIVRDALHNKIVDITVSIHAKEVDGEEVSHGMRAAKKYASIKLSHVDRELARFNALQKEKSAISYWLVWDGVQWLATRRHPTDIHIEWLKQDHLSPAPEFERLTESQFLSLPPTIKREE